MSEEPSFLEPTFIVTVKLDYYMPPSRIVKTIQREVERISYVDDVDIELEYRRVHE